VRREQHGHAGARAQALDEAPDAPPVREVEAGRGLVEEEDARAVHDAAHDVERAPLAARERADRTLPFVLQVEEIEQLVAALRDLRGGEPIEEAGEAQVLGHRERAVERRFLEHDADRSAHGHRAASHVVPGDARIALRRPQQRREHVDRRRLAGAVRPEQPEELPCRNLEIERFDGAYVAVALAQAACTDRGYARGRRGLVHGAGILPDGGRRFLRRDERDQYHGGACGRSPRP
jgi:hypothetical protein